MRNEDMDREPQCTGEPNGGTDFQTNPCEEGTWAQRVLWGSPHNSHPMSVSPRPGTNPYGDKKVIPRGYLAGA
jgi:hypothetical protein